MFFTATFKEGVPYKLTPRKQKLKVTAEARRSLKIWWHALTTQQAPQRRMLRCNGEFEYQTLDIIRAKEYPRTKNTLWLSVEACSWRRPEERLEKPSSKEDDRDNKITIWLETLLEGLEVVDVRSQTVAIVIRTNIYKLAEAIRKDLYVKDAEGSYIAQEIHDLLARLGSIRPTSEASGKVR